MEVNRERVDEVIDALEMAAVYGKSGPIVALINEYGPDIGYDPDDFFESEDGYPVCDQLRHHILTICKVEGAEEFGLGIFGAIYREDLCVGDPLLDEELPVSPEWLAVEPLVPYCHAPGRRLLAEIDFGAGLDADAISDVNEAFDSGELSMDVADVGDFQIVDALDEWRLELDRRLHQFRDDLEDLTRRGGHTISWYDDNLSL